MGLYNLQGELEVSRGVSWRLYTDLYKERALDRGKIQAFLGVTSVSNTVNLDFSTLVA